MSQAQELKTKIDELQAEIDRLEQGTSINPLTASTKEITTNAQTQQSNRATASTLKTTVAKLQREWEQAIIIEKKTKKQEEAVSNFTNLSQQADIVAETIKTLEAELQKLREIGKEITSSHYQETNRIALDDRIPANYNLPKIDKLENSIIIHTENRSLIK